MEARDEAEYHTGGEAPDDTVEPFKADHPLDMDGLVPKDELLSVSLDRLDEKVSEGEEDSEDDVLGRVLVVARAASDNGGDTDNDES